MLISLIGTYHLYIKSDFVISLHFILLIFGHYILNPLIRQSRLVINGYQGNVQRQRSIVLLSQKSPNSTWLRLLMLVVFFFFFSVSIYIPENIISYLGKHKAKHRLSSQITEASLGFNFMGGVPRVSKSNAEIWKLMLCSCMGIYWLYELTYTCYEQKKVQTIFPAHLGLHHPKHWTGFINRPSIGQWTLAYWL